MLFQRSSWKLLGFFEIALILGNTKQRRYIVTKMHKMQSTKVTEIYIRTQITSSLIR